MSGLNYGQRQEVKEIVDDKLNQHSFGETLRKLCEQAHFIQMVKDKADTVVPQVGNEWAKNNLRIETESVANNYMRNNFTPFFRREVSENKEVQGFVSQHLKDVEKQVENTTQSSIRRIVDTSTELNPIFQSHLSILTQRNKLALEEQSRNVNDAITNMSRIEKENALLISKTDSLERSNDRLAGFTFLSLISVAALSYIVANNRRCR